MGRIDKDGTVHPYDLTFYFKTGVKDSQDSNNFKDKRKNAKDNDSDKLCSYKDDEDKKLCSQAKDNARVNVGTTPILPNIKGLKVGGRINTNETLLDLERLPKKPVIIGGGFIGLEFASNYSLFGSEVTILNLADDILLNQDDDVANAVKENYESLGVKIINNASTKEFVEESDKVIVKYEQAGQEKQIEASDVLVAIGRRPNTDDLKLENAGVEVDERGFIKVNKNLQTNKENIFALGDINGGMQFTYISLDDFRIMKSFLFDGGKYNLEQRKNVANSAFIYPTLSQVGLTQKKAKEQGYDVKVASMPASSVLKSKVLGHPVGLYKAIVDSKTDKILGATLYGEQSHEVINIISLAIDMGATYQVLRDKIYTHSTMAEGLNDLFGMIK